MSKVKVIMDRALFADYLVASRNEIMSIYDSLLIPTPKEEPKPYALKPNVPKVQPVTHATNDPQRNFNFEWTRLFVKKSSELFKSIFSKKFRRTENLKEIIDTLNNVIFNLTQGNYWEFCNNNKDVPLNDADVEFYNNVRDINKILNLTLADLKETEIDDDSIIEHKTTEDANLIKEELFNQSNPKKIYSTKDESYYSFPEFDYETDEDCEIEEPEETEPQEADSKEVNLNNIDDVCL